MPSNKRQRKVSTLVSTVTYWLVLAVLATATVASLVLVAGAGSSVVGVVGMVGVFVFAAAGISYGLSMRSRKQAPSR